MVINVPFASKMLVVVLVVKDLPSLLSSMLTRPVWFLTKESSALLLRKKPAGIVACASVLSFVV